MAGGRAVNIGAGSISISPSLAPGFGQLLQAQLNGLRNPTIQINPQINTSQLGQLNRQLNQSSGAADGLRNAFVGAFAALQARGIQQSISQLSGLSNKLTEIAGAATSAGSVIGPLVGLVGGLGAGFAVAGAGVGAFAALAKPQITAVTTATTAASKAQDQYTAALATGDVNAATTAQKNLASATANLTPLQKQAFTATMSLKDAFKQQSDALAPMSLGLYTSGVKTLTGLLPSLTPIATAAGSALQGIFTRAQAGLKTALSDDGGLGAFINVVGNNIKPVLDSLAGSVTNIGRTLSNVFQAAVPIMLPALNVIKQLTGELSNASGGQGLMSFFQQLVPLMQPLRAALTSIGAALGAFIQAALPLAGPVLQAVNMIGAALYNLFQSADFHSFVASVGQVVSAIGPLVQALVGPLAHVISVIAGQFAALLPTLIPVIVQLANVFSQVLVGLSPLLPLFAQLAGILVQFLPILYPIIQALRAALTPVLQAVGQALVAIMPAVQQVISAFTPLLSLFGRLLAAVVPIVAQLITAFVPVIVAILNAVKPLIPIFTQLVQQIGGYFAQALTIVFQAIAPLMPVLSRLASQILTALLQVFTAIRPYLIQIIQAFLSMLPALLPLVQAVVKLFLAFLPLIPVLLQIAMSVLPVVVFAVKAVSAILTELAKVATWVVSSIVVPLVKALGAAWSFIVAGISFVWNSILKPVFSGLGTAVQFLWDWILKPVFTAIGYVWDVLAAGMKAVYDDVIHPIWDAFKAGIADVGKVFSFIVSAIKTVWDGLVDIFKFPINITLDVVSGFAHIVDNVTQAVGLKRPLESMEHIKHLSTGGALPGYGGGDIIPAMLEPGEVVVRKETVAALGGPQRVHQSLNGGSAPSLVGGVLHAANGAPVFHGTGTLSGGLLGGLESGLSTVGSAVFDGGKWVLDEAAHLLRAGAADAVDAAYKGLLRPVLGVLGSTLPGRIARGAADTAEKALIGWIRGKEGSDISGTWVGSGSTLLNAAAKYIGSPYVLGGDPYATPFASDCSGLVDRAMADIGHRLPGRPLTWDLDKMGTKVPSLAQALPGDLLMMNYGEGGIPGPGHVGIYASPNRMLHDPLPGGHVEWINIWETPGDIRRLLSPSATGAGGAAPSGSVQQIAAQMLHDMGWGNQWASFNNVVNRESGWDPLIHNGGGHGYIPGLAYGIPQALPGDKMASAGADWMTNPTTQLRWMMSYIRDAYGDPNSAWEHELSAGWYADGGLASGWSIVGERGPELVNAGSGSRVLSNVDSIQALARVAGQDSLSALVDTASGASGGRSGPLVNIERFEPKERADVDMLADRLHWLETHESF